MVKNINSLRHGFCQFMKHNEFQQFIEENMLHYNESYLMFNKKYNLIYGKFLKEIIMKIIHIILIFCIVNNHHLFTK